MLQLKQQLRVMEAETIQKNEASPKSLMSRRNFNNITNMRKLVSVLICSLLMIAAYGQRIEKREIDAFSGRETIYTTWEVACRNMRSGNTFFRIQKIDNFFILDVKIDIGNKVLGIYRDAELIFLFDNGDRLTLKSRDGFVGGRGQGAVGLSGSQSWGIHARYNLTQDDIKVLQNETVSKFRVSFTDGFRDFEPNRRQSARIQGLFQLF